MQFIPISPVNPRRHYSSIRLENSPPNNTIYPETRERLLISLLNINTFASDSLSDVVSGIIAGNGKAYENASIIEEVFKQNKEIIDSQLADLLINTGNREYKLFYFMLASYQNTTAKKKILNELIKKNNLRDAISFITLCGAKISNDNITLFNDIIYNNSNSIELRYHAARCLLWQDDYKKIEGGIDYLLNDKSDNAGNKTNEGFNNIISAYKKRYKLELNPGEIKKWQRWDAIFSKALVFSPDFSAIIMTYEYAANYVKNNEPDIDVNYLKYVIKHGIRQQKLLAISAIGHIGNESSLDLLLSIADGEDKTGALLALSSIMKIGGPKAEEIINKLARGEGYISNKAKYYLRSLEIKKKHKDENDKNQKKKLEAIPENRDKSNGNSSSEATSATNLKTRSTSTLEKNINKITLVQNNFLKH